MFFALFSLVASFYVNLDVGSQFIRAATIDGSENPSMALNKQGSTLTPNSVSFKLPNVQEGHLRNSNLSQIQVKYGKSSLRNLKKNPEMGAPYIGRLMGRNYTEDFEIPKIATASEMFSLLLNEMFDSKDLFGYEGITFTVPGYFTHKQREAYIKSLYISKLPFLGIIDDFQSIIFGYTKRYLSRFANSNHTVLFIDVGASHAASFLVDFYCNKTTIVANMTSYEWSEETGSFAFARVLASEKGIPFRKAMKLVQEGKFDKDIIESELEELQRIILLALGNTEIDCVQLIGGASKLPYIEAIVEEITDMRPSRELATVEAMALGGTYLTQLIARSQEWPITIIRCPVYTERVRCDKVSGVYCTKGAKCTELVILDNTICNSLQIEAEQTEIPTGTTNLIADFTLTNISKWDREEEEFVSGIMIMKDPLPQIVSVNWCITSTLNCQPISFKQTEINTKSFQASFDFVDQVSSILLKEKRISKLRGQINARIEELILHGNLSPAEKEKYEKIHQDSLIVSEIPKLEQIYRSIMPEEKKETKKVNPNEMFFVEDDECL
ncbi:hypothetical protein TVAG_221570 [Trichomonas vaginalis G3]|uniref:DnaK protein n=1 Tax=Trichomonas vaginalis (strain ATCC PRA-98 / G3) TaxID=412133 RepID=A2E3B3_TRIV3|nr:HSC70CB, isoform G-related family [Trichomonas vaginalis G3]EAY12804.1 hypothetical protein TVAG_221570 [Trichomonas vaginalis G3]KAI5488543.1 HSC70CB, isoform G-related family [Trichomonas vaginalis G3]|eukprot:XP_001325027.1 hypothetical protein [Trichomonas vaginalis G3]